MSKSLDQLLTGLLHERLGHMGPWPAHVRRFVRERAEAARLSELEWLERVRGRPDELSALVDAATVNHTSFYRHREHFTQLAASLPRLLTRRAPLRVWSAGCSTGEETWSIALTLAAHGAPFHLLATDACSRAVSVARRGHYAAALTHGLPGHDGGLAFTAPADLRKHVRFEVGTLLDELPSGIRGPFDIIFCRNVLIYVSPEYLRRAWGRFVSLLSPWGVMAVAPVESLHGVPTSLRRRGPLGWLEPSETAAPSQAPAEPRPRAVAAPVRPAELPNDAEAADPSLATVEHYLSTGDLGAAEDALHELLARNDDGVAWFLLGEVCAKRGATAQAKVAFNRASTATWTSGSNDLETIRAAAKRRARQCG
ncbi:MAG: CheR family methyltransferase [Myxococcales bacterium]